MILTKFKDELGKERTSRDTEKARFLVEAQKWEAEMKDTERKRKNEEEEYVYKDSLTD